MGITNKLTRTTKCDRTGCKTELVYNPQPGPDQIFPSKLRDFIAVSDALSEYTTIYCSDECAILAIQDKQHRQTVQLVVPANEAEAKQVGNLSAAIGKQMKVGPRIIHQ